MNINDLVMSDEALAVIDQGEWMQAGPDAPGVEFKVTGMQAKRADKLMKAKLIAARKANRNKPVTNEQLNRITKEVLVEEVLLDWRGLEDNGEELAYTPELARKFLLSRGGDRFATMIVDCAQLLDTTANDYVEATTKN